MATCTFMNELQAKWQESIYNIYVRKQVSFYNILISSEAKDNYPQ